MRCNAPLMTSTLYHAFSSSLAAANGSGVGEIQIDRKNVLMQDPDEEVSAEVMSLSIIPTHFTFATQSAESIIIYAFEACELHMVK